MKNVKILAALAGVALAGSAFATVTVDTGPIAVLIPDATTDGVLIQMAVASDGVNGDVISGVSLSLLATHPWQGDVVINLTSPMGRTLNILSRPGSELGNHGWSGDNFGNPAIGELMHFADGSARSYALPFTPGITNINNPVGSWLAFGGTGLSIGPENQVLLGTLSDFAGFAGENAVGNWNLRAFDLALNQIGFMQRVVLNITTVPPPGALALLGMGGLAAARRRRAGPGSL